MIFWLIAIYIVIGVIVNIIALIKEPILIYAGWFLIPYFILGVIIFPYVLWSIIFPSNTGGRWI
ncbi:hypothetical protein [Cytobacillus praedii]|uniref:Uncharacterized protein n=1 Tax=Cytobacillus praedii TaxID=1742358 RepID=A0A4R1ASQ7_9BACI|nr:hypothetical protein [Cytobacillus praedii]TCJ01143.1 hypothetical protein E0Y62_25515 [Cytobacillus praedii]